MAANDGGLFAESESDVFRDDDGAAELSAASSALPASESAAADEAAAAVAATSADPTISHRQHLVGVSKLTYPIILSEIFQNTLPVMDIGFVGQLSKDELAAAALATVWFNLWNSTAIGFMTAIDTLLSQSYGANQCDSFAVWAGNSLVITFLFTFVVSGIIALCGPGKMQLRFLPVAAGFL